MSIVAIDLGARRVGIAYSESGILASPHATIQNDGSIEDLVARIAGIGAELEADRYVVGVPGKGRHDAARVAEKYEAFAEALRQKTCKEVVLWDESYTTTEASSRRRDAGKKRRDARTEIDREAAAVLLQAYLDEIERRRP